MEKLRAAKICGACGLPAWRHDGRSVTAGDKLNLAPRDLAIIEEKAK